MDQTIYSFNQLELTLFTELQKVIQGEVTMEKQVSDIKKVIESGQTAIGIELGSTRIKAVMVGEDNFPIASGSFDWENSYIDNIWTYSQEDIWKGLQTSYQKLAQNVKERYGLTIKTTGAIGISAMMHGYMVFDSNDKLLTPFRTWRNNITGQASSELAELFNYPIPQRWSIAHLYQAILNQEEHVEKIAFMTTLAGYLHWQLTGEKVLGVGEASGYFPIDLETKSFNQRMIDQFNQKISSCSYNWTLEDLIPDVMTAGEPAGKLTDKGARLLDPEGQLEAGIPMCPPEGDAGTGMVATNSVKVRTGNVSAGTSVFAMIVLEKELSKVYSELDLVTTPGGDLVAMVHSNNCTSDYDAWIRLFIEYTEALGLDVAKPKIYDTLLYKALEGTADCGGLLSYGYISGEHITGFEEGRPLFVRETGSQFSLANFMRTQLFSSLGALKAGLKILFEQEQVKVSEIRGHGGFFKTKEVGQKMMAAATNAPISVMETAGEGGAWGIALLASFMINKADQESLSDFLDKKIFAGQMGDVMQPDPADVEGFNQFFDRYTRGLPVEKAAVDNLK